jgi:hypothetical protein
VQAADVCVAVLLVDALLGAFVAVQAWRAFGGPAPGDAAGPSYAEYARRGFFELAAVAGLALPLVVSASAAVARAGAGAGARRAFRAAAGLLLVVLGALLVAAADRMRLYAAAYGLTEVRVYVLAFLAWLALVFAWAARTLLRGRPAAFALGSAVLAWGAVFALHAADPAALVVRANAGRAASRPDAPGDAAGRGAPPLDVAYLAALGADAAPALVARVLPRAVAVEEAGARCAALRALAPALARARAGADGGWRGWNLARRRAARAARGADAASVPLGVAVGRGPAWRAACAAADPGGAAPAARASEPRPR